MIGRYLPSVSLGYMNITLVENTGGLAGTQIMKKKGVEDNND
ncbi:hypothetical protein [Paenibacillus sp. FSL H8-0537]